MSKPIKYTLLGLGALILVVVAGVAIFALTFDGIDDLRIAPSAERCDHHRLRFTAREQRAAMRTR